jgi:hypothetical protein
MKLEINKQVSSEIVVFDNNHYSMHPALNSDLIRIPALNIK